MSSQLFDSVQAQITVLPESYNNGLGEGLFIKPTTVTGRPSITGYVLSAENESGKVYWSDATAPSLPASLQSIADLTTSGNELLYTTSSNVYELSSITSLGRSFVSLNTASDQRIAIGLQIGVDVQDHSSILDSVLYYHMK